MDEIDQHRVTQLLAIMRPDQLLALAALLAEGLGHLAAVPDTERFDHVHRLHGSAATLGFAGLAAQLAATQTSGAEMAALAAQAPRVVTLLAAALHGASSQR